LQYHGRKYGEGGVEGDVVFGFLSVIYFPRMQLIFTIHKGHSKTTKICGICEICGRKLSAIFFPADPADSADSSQINFVEWSIDIPFRRNL